MPSRSPPGFLVARGRSGCSAGAAPKRTRAELGVCGLLPSAIAVLSSHYGTADRRGAAREQNLICEHLTSPHSAGWPPMHDRAVPLPCAVWHGLDVLGLHRGRTPGERWRESRLQAPAAASASWGSYCPAGVPAQLRVSRKPKRAEKSGRLIIVSTLSRSTSLPRFQEAAFLHVYSRPRASRVPHLRRT